jgi:TetR/AcrR family transcriptional repressor of nem operon
VLACAIADGRHEGTIRSGIDPRVTARFVLAAWEGTLIEMRAEKSGTAFDDFFEIAFGTLLA